MKIIDLSHPLHQDIPVYPGDKKPRFEVQSTLSGEGYRVSYISMGTHTGTHLDAPAHLLKKGVYLDEFPLSHFYGTAKLIDCRQVQEISYSLIQAFIHEIVPEFLLFYTQTDRLWGKARYYEDYPVLTLEAAQALAELPLKGLGIDAPSFDLPKSSAYVNHHLFLEKNILLIENLCNLEALQGQKFKLSCFPLNINKADGSPVRAVALLDNENDKPPLSTK